MSEVTTETKGLGFPDLEIQAVTSILTWKLVPKLGSSVKQHVFLNAEPLCTPALVLCKRNY